jgi:predicted SAM-dependent methyltransferase
MTIKQRIGRFLFARLPITRFLFDQIRTEVNAGCLRVANALWPPRWLRVRRLRAQRDLLVNVACGPFALDGFVNVDLYKLAAHVIPWDCRWSLPLSDGSAAGVRAEHFVEHLEPREELPAFLRDCLRVLAPGGVLRIVVPDAGRYLQAYAHGPNALDAWRDLGVPIPFPDDLPTRMDVVNHVFHQWHEHRWGYDAETLAHRVKSAGFAEAAVARFGESRLPALARDREVHRPYSLYLEAIKG